jgi:biopolymer transport protein ExbB/TolQ
MLGPNPAISVLAANGAHFALQESTLAGQLVMITLLIGSVFSWSVMITKIRTIRRAKKQAERFLALFRQDRQPLRLYEIGARFGGTPLFSVYLAGCRELTFHLLGSHEVDETFKARLETAPPISSAQMRAVESAMERAVGESTLKIESKMILLATAVSGAPFLGLLGTVWGVMDTFSAVAVQGSAELATIAPGVSAALLTTVTGLLVAIPAMFGYNFLVTTIRGMTVEMDNFAAELASVFGHRYVDHGSKRAGARPHSMELS